MGDDWETQEGLFLCSEFEGLKFCTVDITVTLLMKQSRNKSQKAGTDVFIGASVVIPEEKIVQISIMVTCINRDTGQE